MKDEKKTKRQLIEDLSDLRFRRSVEVVLRQIRDKVWQMRAAKDLDEVLVAVKAGLTTLGGPFMGCDISEVVVEGTTTRVSFHNMQLGADWVPLRRDDNESGAVIEKIWREGKTCYRADLLKEDSFNERRHHVGFAESVAPSLMRPTLTGLWPSTVTSQMRSRKITLRSWRLWWTHCRWVMPDTWTSGG